MHFTEVLAMSDAFESKMFATATSFCTGTSVSVQYNFERWYGEGLQQAREDRLAEAVVAFSEALWAQPSAPHARLNRGVALARQGLESDAFTDFELVSRSVPEYLEGHLNLGKSLAAAGRHEEAIECFRLAQRLEPDSVETLNGLGLSLTHLGRSAEATVVLEQALRLDPGLAGSWSNLGFARAVQGCYPEAERAFCRALELDPALPEAHVNRGNAFKEQGRLAEAIASYDLALALNADGGSARWNRSLALLQSGDFERGWPEYECRWSRGENARRRQYSIPVWSGQDLAGKAILIHSEQGLGDMIMFARYAAALKSRGAQVLFEAPFPLCDVLSSMPAIDEVIPEGRSLPPVDYVVAAMSLPGLLHTRIATIPADVPYLFPNAQRRARLRDALAVTGSLTVGLVWQGNPNHQWDRHRSIRLASLAPLGRVPGVRLVSLQRGPGREQLATCSFPIVDAIPETASEADAVANLADALASVDLVITVDTMPAHLAGAMGVPVWVLLSTMLDWRWMTSGSQSPWYPTMTLFRQSVRDDWTPVIRQVVSALTSRSTATPTLATSRD